MRFPILAVLLLAAASTPTLNALETPLVLAPPGAGNARTDYRVVVNPAIGTMTVYEMSGETLRSWTQYNFLADLEYLTSATVDDNPNLKLAQVGTTRTTPTYPEMYELFSTVPLPDNAPEGTLSLLERVRNSETAFWQQPPAYDGVVRGALSGNMIFLVIPSTYTILVYWLKSQDEVELVSWRNYRTELYVPQSIDSSPTPQELLDILRRNHPEVVEEREEMLNAQIESLGQETMGTTVPLQPSDPWVQAVGNRNRTVFAMFDGPNKRMIIYEHLGGSNGGTLEMKAVRNVEIDLIIPTGYQTEPAPAIVVENYNRRLEAAGLPAVDVEYAIQLSAQTGVTNRQTSEYQITADNAGLIFVDYSREQKLAVYRPFGRNDSLELLCMRDYRPETGLSVATKEMLTLMRGQRMLANAIKNAKRDNAEATLNRVRLALTWNPLLIEEVENSRNRRKLRYAMELDGWGEIIEEAATAAAELEERNRSIEEAVEARREANRRR